MPQQKKLCFLKKRRLTRLKFPASQLKKRFMWLRSLAMLASVHPKMKFFPRAMREEAKKRSIVMVHEHYSLTDNAAIAQ